MAQKVTPTEATQIKLQLLSTGIDFEEGFLDSYGPGFIEKRWAYGNSDASRFTSRIPQEVYVGDVITAIHYVPTSPWKLGVHDNDFGLYHKGELISTVSFPRRPNFYSESLSSGMPCRSVGTLYGGGSLGIFALGTCYYFRIDKSCGFCSLEPTRSTHGDHLMLIKPEIASELTQIALKTDGETIKQVMLNGGNRKDNDENFLHHVSTLRLICDEVAQAGKQNDVEVHLITMPPDNHRLFKELQGLPVKVAMNLEVFSPDLFPVIAPGKAETYGRQKLISALQKAVEVLGKGNVYTIFVGGLEPIDSLAQGLEYVAEQGVVPVINVFHRDPGTRLENHPRSSVDELNVMGKLLQKVYLAYGYEPFYQNCGRNSLDSEAYYGYFV